MATFKIINLSLGTIKARTQRDIYFYYEGVEKITKMISPCDCATPVNQAHQQRILVRYVPKDIPPHLKQKGHTSMTIKKIITVRYVDAGDETGREQTILLSFNATVKE